MDLPAADSSAVVHLLNRLTFGPRPGDIARVQRRGMGTWLEEQLAPDRIRDPVDQQVRQMHPLAFLPPAELYQRYPPPNLQRLAAAPRGGGRMDPRAPDAPPGATMDRPGEPPPDTMLVQRTVRGYRELGAQVIMGTLAREVTSERQLLEVMTDFWFNHFNVFMAKNADRWLTADYVEHAIRPNVLGRFEDLLVAVAQHPAMLVYLDNFQSVAPGSQPPLPGLRLRGGRFGSPGVPLASPAQRQRLEQLRQNLPTGINENYGRELLELHTLGVDGGYTQQDVQNVARILTGWGVAGPARGRFDFEFHAWAHDRGEKVVLGERFPADHGMDEGLRLLHLLAEHPSTARHLAHKLCARFVADDPPDGCVDAAASAWLRTHGDIRAVLRAIVHSPDFWAPQNRRAKVKSPLEFVASALRATMAVPDSTPRLTFVLQQLGQQLFMQQVPTGYPETAEEWVNSGALLARMNVAVGLAAGRLPGAQPDLDAVVPVTTDREQLIARVNGAILGGQGTEHTLGVIRQQLGDIGDPVMARTFAIGLALGSPDFQRQ
jgi:uncharacterized protein (DUF1800 family)